MISGKARDHPGLNFPIHKMGENNDFQSWRQGCGQGNSLRYLLGLSSPSWFSLSTILSLQVTNVSHVPETVRMNEAPAAPGSLWAGLPMAIREAMAPEGPEGLPES